MVLGTPMLATKPNRPVCEPDPKEEAPKEKKKEAKKEAPAPKPKEPEKKLDNV